MPAEKLIQFPKCCRKCSAALPPDALFCHLCGAKQLPDRRTRTRPNGSGSAYRRGKTWTARVVIGWKTVEKNGRTVRRPVWATKGGFLLKRDALAHCQSLTRAGTERPVRVLAFMELYAEWEAAYSDKITHSTLNCYRAARTYFKPLHHVPFAEIDLDALQECLDTCPKGKRTKENMKALASLMYAYALPRRMTDMDYAKYLSTGSGAKEKRPAFSLEQVETIRKSIGTVPWAEEIYCLIYTGFRPGEMFDLTRDDYHPQAGYLIGGIKTAAGRNRPVTLSPKIAEIIRRRAGQADPWLFPREGNQRMTAAYFRDNYFYRALADMGLQPLPDKDHPAALVPYSCRHTFSDLLKNIPGADVDKAALMGHADYETTKTLYQSDDLKSKRAITDLL